MLFLFLRPSYCTLGNHNFINLTQDSSFINIEQEINVLIKNINTKDFNSCRKHFNNESYKIFEKLIVPNSPVICHSVKYDFFYFNNFCFVRNFPITIKHPDSTVFYFSFVFDKDLKIIDLSFSIEKSIANKFLKRKVGQNDYYYILQFIEKYITAYTFNDTSVLYPVLGENELIIKDFKVVETQKKDYNPFNKLPDRLQFKDELKQMFYTNINTEYKLIDLNISRVTSEIRIYGIQLEQIIKRGEMEKKGFLFILVDFEASFYPTISIKNWQYEKNEDGTIPGIENLIFY